MSNQKWKVRPAITNIMIMSLYFYTYCILVNKYSGSCNDNNNADATLRVPDVGKNKY